MTAQELREIHRDINSDREWCEVERVRLTDEERRALTINSSALRANATYLPTVGRARMRRDLAGFAVIALIATAVSMLAFALHYEICDWGKGNGLTKVTHDMTITGEIGTSKSPPGMPIALQRQSSCETWECYYDREVQDFQNATRHGFATPIAVANVGDHVEMPLGADGNIDWAHPIGFAVIDCDGKSTMVEGANEVAIKWDPKLSCLHVSPTKVQHDHGDENSDTHDQRRHADADRKP